MDIVDNGTSYTFLLDMPCIHCRKRSIKCHVHAGFLLIIGGTLFSSTSHGCRQGSGLGDSFWFIMLLNIASVELHQQLEFSSNVKENLYIKIQSFISLEHEYFLQQNNI